MRPSVHGRRPFIHTGHGRPLIGISSPRWVNLERTRGCRSAYTVHGRLAGRGPGGCKGSFPLAPKPVLSDRHRVRSAPMPRQEGMGLVVPCPPSRPVQPGSIVADLALPVGASYVGQGVIRSNQSRRVAALIRLVGAGAFWGASRSISFSLLGDH